MNRLIDFERIKALRTTLGWDQVELARRAAIDRSVVSRIERGAQEDIRASVLIALADAFGVPVDTLVLRPEPQSEDALLVAPELVAALATLPALPQEHQLRIAALLATYVKTVPR